MKKKISLLFAIIFMLVLSTLLTSCLGGFDVPGLEIPEITPSSPSNSPSEDPEDTPSDAPEEPTPTPEVVEQMIPVVYYHNSKEIFRQTISTKYGFTTEKISERDSKILSDYGYKFEFYSDPTFSTPYDFEASEIPGQYIYCKRDMTKAGDNITWSFDIITGKITFTGTGEMYPFADMGCVPWSSYKPNITSADIPEGITMIANYAFAGCEAVIEPIKLPESLKKIGINAFAETSLKEVSFPNGLVEIGKNAFMNCAEIEHIKFNASLRNIGAGAFNNCTGLRSIVLNEYVLDIGSSAFNGCETLSSVYYMGTEEQFNAIGKGFRNFEIGRLSQTWYFASEKPDTPGPFWHYDDDGNIAQWSYAIWYIDAKNSNVAINLKDKSDPKGTPELLVDFVDIDAGFTQANIDYMNNIVYHGYKFAGFKLEGDTTDTKYNIQIGARLSSDIRLVGMRGNICGDNLKWTYTKNKALLTITKIDSSKSDAAMWDFENTGDAPWFGRTINNVTISNGITYIGKNAFCEIKNDSEPYASLLYIEIPTSVTEVSVDAFSGNNGLLYVFYMGTPLQLYGDSANGIAPEITGLIDEKLNNKGLINTSSVISGKVYANVNSISDLTTLGEGNYWKDITTASSTNPEARITWSFDKESGLLTLGGIKFENDGTTSGTLVDYATKSERPWNHYGDSSNSLTRDYEVKSVAILDNISTVGHLTVADFTSVTDITMSNWVSHKYVISDTAFTGTKFYTEQYNNDGTVMISFSNNNKHIIAVNPNKISGNLYMLPDETISVAMKAFNGCSNITELGIAQNIANDIADNALEGLTNLQKIYFKASESEWAPYTTGTGASAAVMNSATVYFYSVSQPTEETGNYWKYGENSLPEIW